MTRTTVALVAVPLLALGLIASAAPSPSAQSSQYVLSSGPFKLPANASSVGWFIVNDSPDSQIVRVTVYRLRIGLPKTAVAPGTVTRVIQSLHSFHNANAVGTGGPFSLGNSYEVVVELDDKRVLPTVDVWATSNGVIVAGTHISPQDFSDIK
jgi:hypothetical protein